MKTSNLALLMDSTFLGKKYGGIARDNLHIVSEFTDAENTYFLEDKNSEEFSRNRINLKIRLKTLNVYCALNGSPKKSFQWSGNYFQTHINGLAGVVTRGKSFMRIHDFFPLIHPEWFSYYGVKVFSNAYKSLDPSTILICNSNSTRDSLKTFEKTKKMRAMVLPCKPDLPNRKATECRSCEYCRGFSTEHRYLLAVSTIEPRKNYRGLFEAWKNVKNRSGFSQLIIIGRLGWKSDQIFHLLNSEPSIKVMSICDFGLQNLYKNASGFISTSFNEGFNLPAAEASSYGIPIALSDVQVHREFHGDYASFFDPFSIKSIEKAIINFPQKIPQNRLQYFSNSWENGIKDFNSCLN